MHLRGHNGLSSSLVDTESSSSFFKKFVSKLLRQISSVSPEIICFSHFTLHVNDVDVSCSGLESLSHAYKVNLDMLQPESIESLTSQRFSIYRQGLKWVKVFCPGEVAEGNRKMVSF